MPCLPYSLKRSCRSPEAATLRESPNCPTWRKHMENPCDCVNRKKHPTGSQLLHFSGSHSLPLLFERLKQEHFIQAFPKFLFHRIYVVIKFGGGLLCRHTSWNRFWHWEQGYYPKNLQMCEIGFGAEWQAEVGRTLNRLLVKQRAARWLLVRTHCKKDDIENWRGGNLCSGMVAGLPTLSPAREWKIGNMFSYCDDRTKHISRPNIESYTYIFLTTSDKMQGDWDELKGNC